MTTLPNVIENKLNPLKQDMQKCVSLSTAKKLKEAGWPQEKSDWVWLPKGGRICGGYCDGGKTHIKYTGKFEGDEQEEDRLIFAAGTGAGTSHEGTHISESEYANDNDLHHLDFIAAPDVSELLEAVKGIIHVNRDERGRWFAVQKTDGPMGIADSPAEALAVLYLELKKRKII